MLERGTPRMPLRADRLQSLLPEPGPDISLGGRRPGPASDSGVLPAPEALAYLLLLQ